MHFTYSDARSTPNEIAQFRRLGLIHPEDVREKGKLTQEKRATPKTPGGYPAYLSAKLKPATRTKMLALLESKGWPLTTTVRDLRDFGANTETARALYGIGYRYPLGKQPKGGYVWEAPEDIAKLHDEWVAKPVKEPEPVCEHPSWERVGFLGKKCTDCGHYWEAPDEHCTACGSTKHTLQGHPFVDDHQGEEPQPEPVEHVDFIDERDSWVANQEELLGEHLNRMLEERLSTLKAVGIEYEIRVWRKKEA